MVLFILVNFVFKNFCRLDQVQILVTSNVHVYKNQISKDSSDINLFSFNTGIVIQILEG